MGHDCLCIIKTTSQACTLFWTGIEGACAIGRSKYHLASGQVELGELYGGVAIVKTWKRFHVAFTAEKTPRYFQSGFTCLLNGCCREHSCGSLVEHHRHGCRGTDDIDHNIDVIRL